MKNKATAVLKRVVSLLTSIAKAKSMTIKSKTNAVKARLIMFSLMKNKKVYIDSISDKIHNLLGHKDNEENDVAIEDQSKAIVLYNATHETEPIDYDYNYSYNYHYGNDDDDKYPDLRHTLFDEEDMEEDQGGSIIDMVRNSKEEEGQDFKLEEEIDHVADLFIKRFHKQMRLQKLQSFKRFQEMLARSV